MTQREVVPKIWARIQEFIPRKVVVMCGCLMADDLAPRYYWKSEVQAQVEVEVEREEEEKADSSSSSRYSFSLLFAGRFLSPSLLKPAKPVLQPKANASVQVNNYPN